MIGPIPTAVRLKPPTGCGVITLVPLFRPLQCLSRFQLFFSLPGFD
jgi:hypothetical protein